MIDSIYLGLCPQCGYDLSTEEIERNLCFHTEKPLSHGKLRELSEKFDIFFRDKTGFEIRALQRMWARRVLSGYSFAAIAPTGIGKTMFGVVMSSFLGEMGKKSYIIVPTTLIIEEVSERLDSFGADFVAYHGKMKKGEKRDAKERIEKGDFMILVTTTAFLSRNYSLAKNERFSFIFVDDVDSLLKRSKNLDKVVSLALRGKGVLMVSTATGSRGYNTKILREKLNFDVGNLRNTIRNVVDVKGKKDEFRNIIKRMGGGALIFVPTKERVEEVALHLPEGRYGVVTAESKKDFELFSSGKLDYLIGVATSYGALIRGLDLPERVRYAIFYGIPRFRVRIEDIDKMKDKAIITLAHTLSVIDSKLRELANKGKTDELRKIIQEIIKKDIVTEDLIIRNNELIVPDIRTYIQGSGRTSRLYSGGITKGASFLLDDEEMLRIFEKRARIYDLEFKELKEVDLLNLKNEIDRDRENIRRKREMKEVVTPVLFIVESPNKARHIASFFGSPNRRIIGNAIVYEVSIGSKVLTIAPSLGHVVDLTTRRGYYGVVVEGSHFIPIYSPLKRCRNCGYQFTDSDKCPLCGSTDIFDSGAQINILRQLAFESQEVIIGTDPDTEGEKIAWDLYNLLRAYSDRVTRAEFHEVTPRAILKAIEKRRNINENLVKAQIVRRVEDRWIGFIFSQILMDRFRDRNLSAGRAQTPVLGWIIGKYDESKKKRTKYFIKGTWIEVPWKTDVCVVSHILKVIDRERTVLPYTTDTALRDISSILKIGSREAMGILQNLFEMGLITYHRTDSTHVSEEGLKIAERYLGENFRPKRWGEVGAHECIRPTRPISSDDLRRYISEGLLKYSMDNKMLRVYDLIFRRFMASQTYWVERIKTYRFTRDETVVEAEVIVGVKGPGYELYPFALKPVGDFGEGEIILPVEERIVSPRPLTQGELISWMKERGIGRPSTYATLIDKLFRRKYIYEKKGYLIPSLRGRMVYDFLLSRYRSFLSEERTRNLERKMALVETGEKEYTEILRELYEEIAAIQEK